jgi:Cu(I)/Ag(I) efflux system membrane fusion protein
MRPAAIVALLAALAAGAAGYWIGARRGAEAPEAAAVRYHCPMHPTYVSDKPGECPICHMALVPIGSAGGEGVAEPMAVEGRATVALTAARRRLLGVRSDEVAEKDLTRAIRTVGRVAVDERRLNHIHVKYDGYVEELYVDFTGRYVKHAEPLLSIYSPDLVATQQEYLLALRARRELQGRDALAQGGQGLLEAARQRLLFWDVRTEDIRRLEETGEVMRALKVYSEHSGYVVQKMAYHGMRVTPADTLYDIADLSQLWVLADVYESDLPLVSLGMRGEVSVPYLPGRRFEGAVSYIAPTVEEKTRTVKVRLDVPNPGEVLKPDMFADVTLSAELGRGLALPEGAVIDTGARKLVFVDREDGRLEPREVRLGVKVGSEYQVLSGLAAGERVATSANFLLDSESSLRAALAGLAGSPAPAAPAHRH